MALSFMDKAALYASQRPVFEAESLRRNVLDLHAGSAALFLADLAVLVAVAIVETRLASLSTPRVTAASPSADRWSNARD
jgi:hypothetical protein